MVNIDGGIAVDAAHSTKNRMTEFRGVDLSTGEIIFHERLGNQTVNIGEFLAMVEAVKYIIEYDYQPKIIYTDSMTAISWFKAKRSASNKRYPRLMKAEIYLRAIAHWIDDIQIVHWNNQLWGEIPADFGRK